MNTPAGHIDLCQVTSLQLMAEKNSLCPQSEVDIWAGMYEVVWNSSVINKICHTLFPPISMPLHSENPCYTPGNVTETH